MIYAGADVNARNNKGETALVKTIVKAHDKCLHLLIQSGADVNFQLSDGNSVLLLAVEKGNSKAVDLLIKGGADVNAVDGYDCTAMIKAVVKGYNNCLKLLLKAGANVNRQSLNGYTVLICAAAYGQDEAGSDAAECAHLLVKAGAHVNRKNNMGQNASMMLHRTLNRIPGRKEEVTKLLFAAGEKMDGITYSVPECIIKEIDSLLNMKHLCRETIRKHLTNIEQHSNLFTRLPQLGLPSSLTTYLLYDLCV